MTPELEELRQMLLGIKSTFRNMALKNWNTMRDLETVSEKLEILNRVPELKKEYDEIKDGIQEYKKALDTVIYKFS